MGRRSRTLTMASIDHAMWFHRPLRVDDWLLYAVESPSASGARGFAVRAFSDSMAAWLRAPPRKAWSVLRKLLK